jgi:CRP/FNR family transcriptional regulator, cyclic AMP receptor protein
MDDFRKKVDEILNIPWFNEVNHVQAERLAKIAVIRDCQPGVELYREGDRIDHLYIILTGEILLENYIPSLGKHPLGHGEALDVIGWSCLTPVVRQHTATARVCKPSRLMVFDGETLGQLCDEDHDLGFLIMRRIANIVATQYLSTRLYLYDIIRNSSHSLAQSNLF